MAARSGRCITATGNWGAVGQKYNHIKTHSIAHIITNHLFTVVARLSEIFLNVEQRVEKKMTKNKNELILRQNV